MKWCRCDEKENRAVVQQEEKYENARQLTKTLSLKHVKMRNVTKRKKVGVKSTAPKQAKIACLCTHNAHSQQAT